MLGIVRFFLASFVIYFHLTQTTNLGTASVNCFYIISGFLITKILNEVYHFKIKEFFLNCFLRLYPSYYFILIIAAFLHVFFKGAIGPEPFHPSWSGDFQQFDIIGNLFIFPWAFLSDPIVLVSSKNNFLYSEVLRYRLIPSTWSVGVEIVSYMLIFIFSSRKFVYAIVTLLISLIWHVYGFNNYCPVPAAMLPFSLGVLCYYLRSFFFAKKTNCYLIQYTIVFSCVFLYINTYKSFYYFNIIVCFIYICLVGEYNFSRDSFLNKTSKLLGDLSYPIFLSHYLGGFIAWKCLGSPEIKRSLIIFIYGYLISILIGLMSLYLIDYRISKIRDKIRNNAHR